MTPVTLSERVRLLATEIRGAAPALCIERAILLTRYFRRRAHRTKPVIVQKAETLAQILAGKTVRLYPGELLVGNFTAKRVGGQIFPETFGLTLLADLPRLERRRVNPFQVTSSERRRLIAAVMPFWARPRRQMALRDRTLLDSLRFLADQLAPVSFLINETGGISHFVPDYAGLVQRGTVSYRDAAQARLGRVPPGSPQADFLHAIILVCDALERFAARYRAAAEQAAGEARDPLRCAELTAIAARCAHVPRHPARSFAEALQAILFAQIALNLESLDNSVCPGRLDQVLWPAYERDCSTGVLDQNTAFELLGCFALKLCEIVPLFPDRVTRFHGGLFNGQVVVVGGQDRDGRDATNELTYLWLELMDQLRTRQPNYHARLHRDTPAPLRARIAAALAKGAASPALYNDEVIIPVLRARGIAEEDARDYATVGCVEPVAAGASFLSTDAALCNVPLCLELALNHGRRFGCRRRLGAATGSAEDCRTMDEVLELLRTQLAHLVGRLLPELRAVERANTRWHPTPLTSMLLRGCLDNAQDASAGGARYNGSGVQGVGVVNVGDSLAAVEEVVFRARRASMAELVHACRSNFHEAAPLHALLRAAPKYGNDDPRADRWTAWIMQEFAALLEHTSNTRGGAYVAGFYSVTAHVAFGERVGALPSGRRAGAPFSSGISPTSGMDRRGPTAALLSAASLPASRAPNGVNFNLKLAPWTVAGEAGQLWLQALIEGGFAAGCMQLQVNVLDPKVLIEARDHPGRHPELLVRVSGYSAYFDDLAPTMQQEIIDRTLAEENARTS
jgi:pyruvate formate-lyase/glycerol dehydratase family glycyl radical enzyme